MSFDAAQRVNPNGFTGREGFDPSQHPRAADGTFSEKVGATPEVALAEPLLECPEGWTEFDGYLPGEPHPDHPGLGWGVKTSEHWGDWSVDTGFYGMQPRYVSPEEPVRWSCNAKDFETAALIWHHRDAITKALADQGVREKRRLRVTLEDDRLVIDEYDRGEFRGLPVPRTV